MEQSGSQGLKATLEQKENSFWKKSANTSFLSFLSPANETPKSACPPKCECEQPSPGGDHGRCDCWVTQSQITGGCREQPGSTRRRETLNVKPAHR